MDDGKRITAIVNPRPMSKRRVRRASAMSARSEHDAAQFQALIEAAPEAVVVVNATGRNVMVNGQTERLFGYAPSSAHSRRAVAA